MAPVYPFKGCIVDSKVFALSNQIFATRWNQTPDYEEIEKAIHTATPAGDRIGNPTDIADIVAFLCEEQSRWVSGSTVCANGGFVPT